MKPALLYLCHRIPYPPNKGDKIRSFNILKFLSQFFDIHLGCFIDEPDDWQWVNTLNEYCVSVCCVNQVSLRAKIKGMQGFVTNTAITLPYYRSTEMQNWVNTTIVSQSISSILVFSAAMAQFVEKAEKYNHDALKTIENAVKVIDFVDVDSDKWRQYANEKSGIKKAFYLREARLLQRYELNIANKFDKSVFVSDEEAELFKSLNPADIQTKIFGIRNGVDTDYFDSSAHIEKLDLPSKTIVFTGAMDYWANVNAILWFVSEVWPLVLKQHNDAYLYIVGSKPTKEVIALEAENIKVTGRVEDVRPYIAQSCFSIAPLQIARGIQNKVLEALSMAKPVVLTAMAAEGIPKLTDNHYVIADTDIMFAEAVSSLLSSQTDKSIENRNFVIDQFSWPHEMSQLKGLLEK